MFLFSFGQIMENVKMCEIKETARRSTQGKLALPRTRFLYLFIYEKLATLKGKLKLRQLSHFLMSPSLFLANAKGGSSDLDGIDHSGLFMYIGFPSFCFPSVLLSVFQKFSFLFLLIYPPFL